MKLVRHAWFLVFPAAALACQLVDPASDLHDGLASGPDGSTGPGLDASTGTGLDAGAGDAAADVPFCMTAANKDADICDDFTGRSTFTYDGGPWVDASCDPLTNNGNVKFYFSSGGVEFKLPFDDSGVMCAFESRPQPVASRWTLDFDLDASFGESVIGDAAPVYLGIARLDFSYDAGVDGSALYQSFRLLVGNDNTAKLVEVEQTVGMAAPEEVLVGMTIGEGFLSPLDPALHHDCHITMAVFLDDVQDSTAQSNCGPQGVSFIQRTPGNHLLATTGGSAVLFLGYDDPGSAIGDPFQRASLLDYDNVTLSAAP